MKRQQRKLKRPRTKGKKLYRGRKKKQTGGFLNWYDFAYAGRDTVNQTTKVAPGVIKNSSSEINNTATERINQSIADRGKGVERVLPKILRGATEDIYQTQFMLLRNFGKYQLNKLKRKILN